jgi:hypothetical protein
VWSGRVTVRELKSHPTLTFDGPWPGTGFVHYTSARKANDTKEKIFVPAHRNRIETAIEKR